MRLLDTDVCVDLFHEFPPALQWLASLVEEPLLPGFAVLELLEGCRNAREIRRVEQRIAGFQIVWGSAADCERAVATFAAHYLRHNLGVMDALIAETAIGLGAVLCTFNVRHFRAVPGLVTEQPYRRRNV
jgi:predicted nucleic acid-binding protein